MDVLAFWRPSIEESNFSKGKLSNPFWQEFFDLIQLCHCVEHWAAEKQEAGRMARQVKNGGWEKAADSAATHEMRSRWLAAEKVWNLQGLAKTEQEHVLASSVLIRTALSTGDHSHTTANFRILAITLFDGSL